MPRVTLELARRLLATGAIAARDVEAALYLSVVRGVSIARALVDRGVLSERALEDELSRRAGLPLRQVHPSNELIARLPRGMCRMLAAVPLRHDPVSGVTEIAAVDPLDGHVATEFTFHLGTPIRVQRASMASIEEAIRRLELADGNVSVRPRRRTPAFPHGAPDTVPPSRPSSQPPPEEVPIPLIRRVPHPTESEVAPPTADTQDEPFPGNANPTPPPPASVPGEATIELMRRSPSSDATHAMPKLFDLPRAHDEAPDSEENEVTRQMAQRRKVMQSAPDIPTTSFPSIPPPSGGPEHTAAAASPLHAFHESSSDTLQMPAVDESDYVGDAPPTHPEHALSYPIEEEQTPVDSLVPAPFGPEPETIPRALDAGWSPTLPELLDLIARARARDDLLDLVLRALTLVAQRVAVFVVRREGFMGWSCNPAFGSEEDLRRVVIPSAQPSIFATSAATGFYLGPIPRTPVHASLLRVIGRASADVAVYVAKAQGRPAIVCVADQLDDTLLGTRALGEITKRAGEALTRVLGQR